ncbi:MAG: NERD domain-containing protein [Deltaproteobacteria bacterium]|nr:NERD domain-containing protein [Deltaproteobacteria bacterium]
MRKDATFKSPLKDRPLRGPGQSLEEEIQRTFDEEWMPYFLAPMVCLVLAATEWWRYFRPTPASPWIVTAIAVLMASYSAMRLIQLRPRIRNLRLGMEGEKAVGQSLEELRAIGATIFHDVPADGFNVDHVVVSRNGIFVIETKTCRKPKGPGATVTYDGVKVLVNGREPDRDPIWQVRGNAAWVQKLLKESTGKPYPARPVVLFPGWYVETVAANAHDKVWVLNPRCLSSFIQNENVDLPAEDVSLAAFHLSRYIRSKP